MTEKMMLQQSTALGSGDNRLGRTISQRQIVTVQGPGRRSNESNFYINPAAAPNRPVHLALKRGVDIFGSFCGLLVLCPVILMIALMIKLESKGPVFFRQLRTGLNETPFEILKFRSMFTDLGDESGVRQTVSNDPRITRVGRFLRKTNLDELPQLWNVLIGDMSLVGPRPHVPDMLAAGRNYAELVQGYENRHLMRPGLTGLAQARGLRGPTSNRWKAIRRIVCDVEYVRNFSLLLDFKIILRTVMNELKGGTGF
jgi:lipopolysaccharide/colanic/teichoic acid biosynthesis glycosyltransferase